VTVEFCKDRCRLGRSLHHLANVYLRG